MDSLIGKTILITGASSGIGKQITLSLLDHKVNLYLVGRNKKSLENLKDRTANVANVSIYIVDFSDKSDLESFLQYLKEISFEPDILIHCAGIFHHGSIQKTTNHEIDSLYKVNFRAPFIITRDLLASVKKKNGQIIFINSTASLNPRRDVAAYASIKAALTTLAEVIYHDVSPEGVRVTSIFPGRVDTPMQKYVCKMEGREYTPEKFLDASEIASTVLNVLTLPRDQEVKQIIIRPS